MYIESFCSPKPRNKLMAVQHAMRKGLLFLCCFWTHLLIFYYTGWKESFYVIIGGDEVSAGKPSPEMWDRTHQNFYSSWLMVFCPIMTWIILNHEHFALVRFLEAAKKLKIDPSNCLVIEDSLWVYLFTFISLQKWIVLQFKQHRESSCKSIFCWYILF